MKFLGYRLFGILGKEDPEENEDQMKYDAFFCYRYKILYGITSNFKQKVWGLSADRSLTKRNVHSSFRISHQNSHVV